jgi:hypothetical protein
VPLPIAPAAAAEKDSVIAAAAWRRQYRVALCVNVLLRAHGGLPRQKGRVGPKRSEPIRRYDTILPFAADPFGKHGQRTPEARAEAPRRGVPAHARQ